MAPVLKEFVIYVQSDVADLCERMARLEGLFEGSTLECPPVTDRPSRGRTVGSATSSQRSSHIARCCRWATDAATGPPPGQASVL